MKKIISRIFAAALALSLVLSLTACGAGSSAPAPGVTIAFPNDPTNEARALLLLEQLGAVYSTHP